MRFFNTLLPVAAIAAVVVSGCATNRYCLGAQDYQSADNRPVLTVVDGLKLPESATALKIPPAPPASVPFGVRDAKGNGVCLDKPPPMQPATAPGVPIKS